MNVEEVEHSSSGESGNTTRSSPPLSYARSIGSSPITIDDSPLTRFAMTVVAVRIAGIYALVQAAAGIAWPIGYAISWMQSGRVMDGLLDTLMVSLPVIAYGFASFFLLTRAERIAAAILPKGAEPATDRTITPAVVELQAAAFAVVGIALCLWALPEALSAIWWHLKNSAGEVPVGATEYAAPDWITFAIQAALGVWLFLGSKGLAAFWHRLRHPELAHSRTDARQH